MLYYVLSFLRLALALDEERSKNEERIKEAVESARRDHEELLRKALSDAEQEYLNKLDKALKEEREASLAAIEKACEEERKKSQEKFEELKVTKHAFIVCNHNLFNRRHILKNWRMKEKGILKLLRKLLNKKDSNQK